MKLNDLLKISLINIKNNRLKYILVIISICIGITSVTLISSVGSIAQKNIDEQLQSMGIDGISVIDVSSNDLLTDDFVTFLNNRVDIDVIMPMITKFSTFTNDRVSGNALVAGVGINVDDALRLDFINGNNFTNDQINNKRNVVIIDETLAMLLYERTNIIGKNISLIINGTREEYEIIGVIKSQKVVIDAVFGNSSPSFFYVPITTLSEILNCNSYDMIAVRNYDDMDILKENLEFYIEKNEIYKDNIMVQNISSYMDIIKKITEYITILLLAIAGISMVVANVGVVNIMLSSAIERKKEIGVYLALGATKKDVGKIFLLESVIICVLSGILGALIGIFLVFILTQVINVKFYISIETILIILLLSLIFGIISGIFPSIKASKLNPIEVLRD